LRVLSDLPCDNNSNSTHKQQQRPVQGIGSFATKSDTNQRLEFDLSYDGKRLFVGGMDKCVRIYDTQQGQLLDQINNLDDAANGVSFTQSSSHPLAYLAVATGSRRFPSLESGDGCSDDEQIKDDKSSIMDAPPGFLRLYRMGKKISSGEPVTPLAQDTAQTINS
jgi:WD40 repeat protein